ncbi:gluconokinase [Trinickia dinghuensis]|uniref:Gluconokinase n=1 Tax=Trinickia dinghuensis TaxID=2291023 RepID=A0A3D8JPG0_9BURK|nr:gluconokinase [Trinickia dinghuensis]RDU94770.1 gluconokinase [Trinickia dinghuensis]
MILIVMGVSGAGKTRIGELIAERLGCSFVDGDEFHSAANKEKMAQGVALTDDDRWPWLAAIRAAIEEKVRAGQSLIVGCSSLKRAYRDVLRGGAQGDGTVHFVYLKGSFELLHERLATRGRHFFNPALLQSQLDTLEEPGEDEAAITVGIELTPDEIVDQVVAKLK